MICLAGSWFVIRRSDSSCGVLILPPEDLIRPAHGRSHHYGHYGKCPYKFRNAQKLVRNARTNLSRLLKRKTRKSLQS